jgi:hypothetical protein
MTPSANGPNEPAHGSSRPLSLLGWALLALLLLTGLALGAPREMVVQPAPVQSCPYLANSGPDGPALLPPGHPPIGGQVAGRGSQARPLSPVFVAPASIDL